MAGVLCVYKRRVSRGGGFYNEVAGRDVFKSSSESEVRKVIDIWNCRGAGKNLELLQWSYSIIAVIGVSEVVMSNGEIVFMKESDC